MTTLSWGQPRQSVGNATTESKYWNYSGNPISTNLTTTPATILTAVTQPRLISYSADATDGVIIDIWINTDPATEPPTLKSYGGHNVIDWPVSGQVKMATESGTAIVIVDTATETPAV